MYGDTNMGATDEAVLQFLKTPMNKPIFDAFKTHVHPEFAKQIKEMESPASDPAPAVSTTKKTSTKKQ